MIFKRKLRNDRIFTFDPVSGTTAKEYLHTTEFDKFLAGFRKYCVDVLKHIHADAHNRSYMDATIETNVELMRASLDLQKADHDYSAYVICNQIEGYETLLQAQEEAIGKVRDRVMKDLAEISATIERADGNNESSITEVNE